ncbi:hypothetical protein MHBO_001488 [Bonamia ostreae]|uniref:acetate--CoA ligase n=1 Tax=Bonamia ostreae TaxID=126728 RepID=A0ABV2AJM8_9EUKA
MLDWLKPFSKTSSGSFQNGDIRWFLNGKLNACLNCVDRHLPKKGSHTAIVWEGDDGETREISFLQLHQQVCKLTNCLRRFGVKKGDVVCIYMPMVPEAAFAMLACARIGAPHSVVFAGFSSSALGDRLKDCGCKVVITAEKVNVFM